MNFYYTLAFILVFIIGAIMYNEPPEKCWISYNGAGFIIAFFSVVAVIIQIIALYLEHYDITDS